MPRPSIEIYALDSEIRASLHPPFVKILDAKGYVFKDTLDATDVSEKGCGGEREGKFFQYLDILLNQWDGFVNRLESADGIVKNPPTVSILPSCNLINSPGRILM